MWVVHFPNKALNRLGRRPKRVCVGCVATPCRIWFRTGEVLSEVGAIDRGEGRVGEVSGALRGVL